MPKQSLTKRTMVRIYNKMVVRWQAVIDFTAGWSFGEQQLMISLPRATMWWDGGGTHTGPAFSDFLIGSLPAATGRKMRFTGTTVLKLKDGKIVEEIGLDDGVTALQQLGLINAT